MVWTFLFVRTGASRERNSDARQELHGVSGIMSQSHGSAGAVNARTVTVIHGRQRHVVELGTTSLELMQKIAEVTSIKAEDQMLIIGGKKFTADKNVDLASLGVKGGKKVLLMNKGKSQSSNAKPSSSDDISKELDEEMCRRVVQSVSRVSGLHKEAIEINEQVYPPHSCLDSVSPSELKDLERRVLVISETCMEILISLDNLSDGREGKSQTSPVWKLDKRHAVHRVQHILDIVDSILKVLINPSPSGENSTD